MGTPQYMAPEQFENPLEVDHRADLHSLGVVFYELLAGKQQSDVKDFVLENVRFDNSQSGNADFRIHFKAKNLPLQGYRHSSGLNTMRVLNGALGKLCISVWGAVRLWMFGEMMEAYQRRIVPW